MILYGIAVKPVKKGPMHPTSNGLITSTGLDGNYYSKLRDFIKSKRQITVISLRQWNEALDELGVRDFTTYPWYLRRANLCVTSRYFMPSDVGKQLSIGPNVLLEITGETAPCSRMDEVLPGLKWALTPKWRGGVTCRVIRGGEIYVGNRISIH